MSFHEVTTMTAFGMPGVSSWNFGESFSQLYLDSVAMNHNSIGRGYETQGNGTAETLHYKLDSADTSGVVAAESGAGGVRLVGARQLELQRDRSVGSARLCGAEFQGDAAKFLQEELEFVA
jgi:hypothetical protein